MDLSTARLVLITYASFANSEGSKIKLVYLILLVGATNKDNIIYCRSNKSKLTARSVIVA